MLQVANNPNLKRGPGRPKGSLNKTTNILKDALIKAAAEAWNDVLEYNTKKKTYKIKKGKGEDLIAYLRRMAVLEPAPFMSMLSKVLPHQLTGADDGPIKHEHEHKEAAEFIHSQLDRLAERQRQKLISEETLATGSDGSQVVVAFPGTKGST